MLNYRIAKELPPQQVADLRAAVGWNRLEKELQNPALDLYFCIGCYDGEQLVGYLAVVSNRVTDAYIQDVIVTPAYQGRGIGTQLMETALAKIKADGISMISVIYGEESLRTYYERFGFYTMLAGQMEWDEKRRRDERLL